jgi:hypothetical protein
MPAQVGVQGLRVSSNEQRQYYSVFSLFASMHLKIPVWANSPRTITGLLVVYGVVSFLLIAHSLFSVWVLYQPLPLDDHMDFMIDLQRWYDGAWRAADWWKQHNEHRILVPRLFFLTDVLFFSGNNVFLVTFNIVLQTLHVLLLWHIIAQADLPRPARWAAGCASALFLLSAVNLENFLWAFQIQFILVFLAVSAACVALFTCSSRRVLWLALTIVLGFIATFSLANGVLIWPILIGLAALGGLGWRTMLTVAAAGLVIGGACLLSFQPHPGHASPFESVRQPLTVLHYTVLYLSGPFGDLLGRWFGAALGSLGLMVTLSLTIEAMQSRRQLSTTRLALLGIAGFVVASAFVTALGRINFPLEQALSARYFTPALIYWIATLVSCLAQRSSPLLWRQRAAVGLGLGCLVVLSVLLVPQQYAEIRRWTVRTNNVKVGTAALLTNVQDNDSARFIYPSPHRAFVGNDMLRSHNLSIYSTPMPALLGHRIEDIARIAPLDQCSGAIAPGSTITVAAGLRGGFRLSGWIDRQKSALRPDLIALVSESGMVVGLGAIHLPTSFLTATRRRPTWTWTGYVAERFQARQVTAYILSFSTSTAQAIACRLATGVQAPEPPAPFTALSAPLNDISVVMTGGWSLNGQHPAGGLPPVNAPVYGSWSGADENTGALRLGPFTPGDHKALGVPLVTGPDTTGLSAKLVDANSGKIIARLDRVAFSPHQWVVWRLDLPSDTESAQLLLVFEDAGSGWGQWFAVATPFWLTDES